MAGTDEFAQPDLVGHVREHFPQPFTVTTIGGGGDAVPGRLQRATQQLLECAELGAVGGRSLRD